jgi:hypothetical protein
MSAKSSEENYNRFCLHNAHFLDDLRSKFHIEKSNDLFLLVAQLMFQRGGVDVDKEFIAPEQDFSSVVVNGGTHLFRP